MPLAPLREARALFDGWWTRRAKPSRATEEPGGVLVSLDHLTVKYGDRVAVDDLSFSVSAGEVVGLLGPNGAGKTTTIEVLEGFRRPTSGSVRVLGRDPGRPDRRLRNRVGIVLQAEQLEPALTVRETCHYYGSLYRPRMSVSELLKAVELEEFATMRVGRLSGGERRRLQLALSLVGRPMVIFLDEPTTGLDVVARHHIWELVGRLRASGVAVLLTSHYLEEVEALADRVVVLQHGRMVANAEPDEIGAASRAFTLVTFRRPVGNELPSGPWQLSEGPHGTVVLRTRAPTATLAYLASWAVANGVELESLQVRRPSLEEAYLEITGSS